MADEKSETPDAPDKQDKQDKTPAPPESKLGGFLQRYATLLSSTVLGIAGLAATSIWQCRQSSVSEQQARAQQQVAATQADNSWKIERADILSKNIAVLSAAGPETAEQRYGVLLSLTRGNLLDPELAESYALELGKDNAENMASVLGNVPDKDYARLARAYTVSCKDRYGISPAIEGCTNKLEERSKAIAQLVSDETDTAITAGKPGPMVLLDDEHEVQMHIQRVSALFTPLLNSLYEDRKWDSITKFSAHSNGAHLVSALVLAAAHTGEFVTDAEAKQLKQFDDTQAKWLAGYLGGPTCDAECRSRSLSTMVSHFAVADHSFDAATKLVIEAPRAQSGMAVSFLHTRLLWCQVDPADAAALRDDVLVPSVAAMVANPKAEPAVRDSLLSLMLLVPDPSPDDAKAMAGWNAMNAAIIKAGDKFPTAVKDRKATAAKQRANPPPAFKKVNFCAVQVDATGSDAIPPLQ